jgi:hypothetical protein
VTARRTRNPLPTPATPGSLHFRPAAAPPFRPGNRFPDPPRMGNTGLLPDAPAYALRGVNLFASGRYRGRDWTPADVARIARNARRLGPELRLHTPPAAPGHEDDDGWQKFVGGEVDSDGPEVRTDEPAAGWVHPASVRAVRDPRRKGHLILRGDVLNIPRAMAEKIARHEYRFGSAEIYQDFTDDDGKSYGKALRKFSFLGSEPPQVKGLGPLPTPEPQAEILRFAEGRPGWRVRERRAEVGGRVVTFAETVMDRAAMIAAAQAAMPNLSAAFLEALSDDQIAEFVAALPGAESAAPTATPPAGGVPMAEGDDDDDDEKEKGEEEDEEEEEGDGEMADDDPAEAPGEGEMTREDMIDAVLDLDPTATPEELEGLADDELMALLDELSAAPEEDPAAPAPVAPMSDRTKTTRCSERPKGAPVTATETKRVKRRADRFAEVAYHAEKQIRRSMRDMKRRDAESFCEQLVRDGRATPGLVAATILPSLLRADNLRAAHAFTEGGRTRKRTEYDAAKAELAWLPVLFRHGERFGAGRPATTADAELARVREFADQLPDRALEAAGLKSREQFVEKFAECQKKAPGLTAKQYLGV